MSDKTKWAGIYLLVCFIPVLFYLKNSWDNGLAHEAPPDFLKLIPYVGLTLVAVLGWKINQTRIFWSTLLLLLFYHYMLHPERFPFAGIWEGETLQMISVVYPLALAVIYSIKESKIWSDTSLARILLALSPLPGFICLHNWTPDVYQNLLFWGPRSPTQMASLPWFCFVALGLFFLVAGYLTDPKIKSFLVALSVTLVLVFFCIDTNLWYLSNTSAHLPRNVITFVTITVILLFAVLRMYWQKVYLDTLTAVSNRQALDERLHTLDGTFALAMVDIDHFKKFNDTYGHDQGDNVLRMVAQHLQENLGTRVYRYGGEEFCVVFEKTNLETAKDMMEKTRASLEKRKFALRSHRNPGYSGLQLPFKKGESRGKRVHITVSVGVAPSTNNHKTAEEVIKRADHALYEAKEKGRNRVVSAG